MVLEGHHLDLPILDHDPAEARESPDPVVEVDHQIAASEVAEIGHESARPRPPRTRHRRGGEVPSTVDREAALPHKAVLRPTFDNRHIAFGRRSIDRRHAAVAQEVGESFSLPDRRHHQHLGEVLPPPRPQGRHQIGKPADEVFDCARRNAAPRRRPVHQLEPFDPQCRLIESALELIRVLQQGLGGREIHFPPAQGSPLAQLNGPPPANLAHHLVAIAHHDVRNQLDPAGSTPREMERAPPQPAFGALGRHTRQRRVVSCQYRGDPGQPHGIGGKWLERDDGNRILRVPHSPLGGRVEEADGLDNVVVELEPNPRVAAGVEIDHPPANGELARLFHQIGAAVAGGGESSGQVAGVNPDADPQLEGAGLDHRRFRDGGPERTRRHHHEIDVVARESDQEIHQPQPCRQGGFGAEIGTGHLGRHHANVHSRREQTERRRQVVGVGNVGNHHKGSLDRPPRGGGGRENQRPGAGDHTAHSQPLHPAIEVADERAEVGERISTQRICRFGRIQF